jgi:hypothetical protein
MFYVCVRARMCVYIPSINFEEYGWLFMTFKLMWRARHGVDVTW